MTSDGQPTMLKQHAADANTDGPISGSMRRALELARSVVGTTSPNPAVGAVLVQNGEIVGQGATRPPGGAHAEVVAIERAGAAAQGATLYVTLEPCSTRGRTHPCTDTILAVGIERVVVAMRDADTRVDGRGIQQLREAGVVVEVGDGTVAARRLYEAYTHHRRTGRPFVIVKFAASLDGKIAATSGDSRWISSPETRAWAHTLRTKIDAILVGVSTVIVDDPELTARPHNAREEVHQPLRVVLDSRGRVSAAARVLRQQDLARTVVLTTSTAPREWQERIEATGAVVERVAAEDEGHVALEPALRMLAERYGVVTLLIEGGGTVHGSLFDRGLVDKVTAIVAPLIIGGDGAGAVGGRGAPRMAEALRLRDVSVQQLGPDLLVSGYPRWPRSLAEIAMRPAGLADRERCVELARQELRPAQAEETVRAAFDTLERDAGNIWLAVIEDAVVGVAGLSYAPVEGDGDGTTALLDPLLVADDWWESEMAERLVEMVEASAAGRGFDWLATALPGNDGRRDDDARREWAARGYRYYRRSTGRRTLLIKELRSGRGAPLETRD
jgi:diaminohydroxyphosphoribosylaminopyrimidine deaminase/5-amino-6-(5-phosphoribosylamino)uracil reductase